MSRQQRGLDMKKEGSSSSCLALSRLLYMQVFSSDVSVHLLVCDMYMVGRQEEDKQQADK